MKKHLISGTGVFCVIATHVQLKFGHRTKNSHFLQMAIYLISVISFLASCDAKSVTTISMEEMIKNIDNPNYLIIDTRHDSFYNGFKEPNAKRGGHIKGAIQFSKIWIDYIEDDKFENFVAGKGISKDKTLVVYGSDSDSISSVSIEFISRGYKVKTFREFLMYTNNDYPMEKFPNYQFSVSPQWVHDLIENKKPETYDNNSFMIFEVSWGPREKSKTYVEHIPGAYHFNTDWVENAPVWNLSEPKVVEANLLKAGITKDKTIVLYSQHQLAAYRVFWALKWAGVSDVRVMNGSLSSWGNAEFSTETKVNMPEAETTFGAVIPENPHITIATANEAQAKQKEGLKLISNRSWPEYIGDISGYNYILGIGEPQGAIWGFAGTDSNNMADYYDPDGTLRNPKEIFALWESQGIHRNDKLAFYCGTGWRAGVSWFITQLAAWNNAVVYDGGWNAWQMDSSLPVQKGAPKGMQKPDAKNTFGTPGQKKAASCKD